MSRQADSGPQAAPDDLEEPFPEEDDPVYDPGEPFPDDEPAGPELDGPETVLPAGPQVSARGFQADLREDGNMVDG